MPARRIKSVPPGPQPDLLPNGYNSPSQKLNLRGFGVDFLQWRKSTPTLLSKSVLFQLVRLRTAEYSVTAAHCLLLSLYMTAAFTECTQPHCCVLYIPSHPAAAAHQIKSNHAFGKNGHATLRRWMTRTIVLIVITGHGKETVR